MIGCLWLVKNLRLLTRLWIERTPSGGFHVAYRTDQNIVEGNKMLAKTRIEVNSPASMNTRGKNTRRSNIRATFSFIRQPSKLAVKADTVLYRHLTAMI